MDAKPTQETIVLPPMKRSQVSLLRYGLKQAMAAFEARRDMKERHQFRECRALLIKLGEAIGKREDAPDELDEAELT